MARLWTLTKRNTGEVHPRQLDLLLARDPRKIKKNKKKLSSNTHSLAVMGLLLGDRMVLFVEEEALCRWPFEDVFLCCGVEGYNLSMMDGGRGKKWAVSRMVRIYTV